MSSSVIPATTPVSWTRVPDGTAALPSFSFQNSQGTGIYRVSADVLGLSTAGVQRVVIDASGNVGVGKSPTYRLDIQGAIGENATLAGFFSGTNTTRGFTIGLSAGGGAVNDGYVVYNHTLGGGNSGHIWQAGGTERMRIDASGNLLVGKTTASDTAGAGVYVTPAGGIYSTQTGSINYLTCYNTTASAYRFYVTAAGQVNATSTSIAAISDASLKENVRDLETGLSQVLALKPRRFDWKEETQIDQKDVAGFIAQEVEEILPDLVYEYKYNETETKKSLKMGDMLPTLVKAIQELSAKVDAQAAEIEALKAK